MQIIMGRDSDTEALENLHFMSEHLKGDSGLFFTNRPLKEVQE